MYNVQCAINNVQCTMYNVQCTMCNVQCTMYNIQCAMYIIQCTYQERVKNDDIEDNIINEPLLFVLNKVQSRDMI